MSKNKSMTGILLSTCRSEVASLPSSRLHGLRVWLTWPQWLSRINGLQCCGWWHLSVSFSIAQVINNRWLHADAKLDVEERQVRSFIDSNVTYADGKQRWFVCSMTAIRKRICPHKSFHLGEVQFRFKLTQFLTPKEKQSCKYLLYAVTANGLPIKYSFSTLCHYVTITLRFMMLVKCSLWANCWINIYLINWFYNLFNKFFKMVTLYEDTVIANNLSFIYNWMNCRRKYFRLLI